MVNKINQNAQVDQENIDHSGVVKEAKSVQNYTEMTILHS